MKMYLLLLSVLYSAACSGDKANKPAARSNSVLLNTKSMQADKSVTLQFKTKADSVAFNADSTAVIVVDMQNDFGSKGGMFHRAGIDISMIQKAVAPTSKVLDAARLAGIKIIFLKMGFKTDLSDMSPAGAPNYNSHILFFHAGDTIINPAGAKSRILIRDNWGTEIVSQLTPQQNDISLYKNRFSGFFNTGLDSILKRLNKKYLIFTGCTTSICVESTVRDASFRDYWPIVLEDCTAEPVAYGLPGSNHQASLFVIQKLFGWVSSSNEFIKAVTASPASDNLQSKNY